ncbi:MAG TPA: DUF3857 domain-containing protein [Chitinophagaceae bacterium]|nr:DUF3857 domain-containing protein [Chitinophagaceae bacterium]
MKPALFYSKALLLSGVLLISLQTIAQSPELDVRKIPAGLTKNASTVIRYEENIFDVKNISEATLKVHQYITILNENGSDDRVFQQYTNKFITLGDVDIRVYDSSGKQVEKYRKKDMTSVGSMDGLVDEGKANVIQVKIFPYPFTVEFEYTINYKGTLFYPEYHILSPEQAVEKSLYRAIIPTEFGLRYREKNIKLSPVINEAGGYKTYEWSVKNLPAILHEEGAVSAESRYPEIILAPNRFKLDDFEGDMSSWKEFGTWYYKLTRGMDQLSDERINFFRNLVKDAPNEREKIRRIYSYLQGNFRYVSIQLGVIGGYRPLPAVFTDQKKYGDCKGLSNYMQAALEAVGVKSHQALINASYDKEPVSEDFPCNMFNHVIVCVPQSRDSIWLECTSRTNEFGVLGNFTENRNALLITENGGVLVPTPRSKPEANKLHVMTVALLQPTGFGKTTSTIIPTGEFKTEMIYRFLDQREDDQKNFIVNSMGFKQPDAFHLTVNKIPDMNLVLDLEIEKLPDLIAGSKMFLAPSIYSIWSKVLPESANRTQDYYFECPFDKSDTTLYKLPEGYVLDALPPAKKLECEAGRYSTSYWFDEKLNAVCAATTFTLWQYKIPAATYPSVKKFFDDVILDHSQRIVIKRTAPRPF